MEIVDQQMAAIVVLVWSWMWLLISCQKVGTWTEKVVHVESVEGQGMCIVEGLWWQKTVSVMATVDQLMDQTVNLAV